VPPVRLRPIRPEDWPALIENRSEAADPWNFFGHQSTVDSGHRTASTGAGTADAGALAVESLEGKLLGEVSWNTVQHGPSPACRALNVGITLIGEHRGHGYGTAAQAELADYLFQTTRMERLEAATDVDNIAEQRSLEKAGFHREGVLRHAQFRAGQWRDVVLFSRLRHDPPVSAPS
jgi:RimJ/RimL family protein N-acetyltransferase